MYIISLNKLHLFENIAIKHKEPTINTSIFLDTKTQLQQQLALTQDMLQSLEILTMAQCQLNEHILKSACENPLIHIDEASSSHCGEFGPVAIAQQDKGLNTDSDYDGSKGEKVSAISPVSHHRNDSFVSKGSGGEFDFSLVKSQEQTFSEMLEEQLYCLKLPILQLNSICHYLIVSLNKRGWLEYSVEEIANELGAETLDVLQGLYVIQSLQPIGVGARNLEECLMLQLMESPHFGAETIKLVKEGLPLLAKNDITAIAKLLKTTKTHAKEICNHIRELNPIPTQGYYTGKDSQYVVPDAVIEYRDEMISIVMNDYMLPKVSVHQEYYKLLSVSREKSDTEYLKIMMPGAKALVKNIQDRNHTLYCILETIVSLQGGFFTGTAPLSPMTLDDVAQILECNISTVSRGVQEKYIRCHRGVIELKTLFTRGVSSGSQDGTVSVDLVKEKIKQMVKLEDSNKPLSDENICTALEAINITISRRTVAKYRLLLGILPSFQRKNR